MMNQRSLIRKVVSSSKKIISTLESKFDILNKKIVIFKEKHAFVSDVSSCTSCENIKENIFMCCNCSILKNKLKICITHLHNSQWVKINLTSFWEIKRELIIKLVWAINQNIMKNFFRIFFCPNKTSSTPFVKCFYCERGDTSSICNLRKNNDMNNTRKWVPNGTFPKANS